MITLIIPCKNEYGTIFDAIERGVNLPFVSEVFVVVGESHDNTFREAIRAKSVIDKISKATINIQLQQESFGKWNAVKLGIGLSKNEFISIWDADLTVSFTEQCLMHERFMASLKHRNQDSLVMGDRMSYREPGSMRFSNFIGNKIFAIIWTKITKTPINDMLCGSKIFSKKILDSVPDDIKNSDPYGDFTIVFGAVISQKPVEVQIVSYRARTYGQTNILRWSGALQLFRFTLKAILFNIRFKSNHV